MTDSIVVPFTASGSTEQSEIDRVAGVLGARKQDEMPGIPEQLSKMPAMLGEVQKFIHGTMSYPCLSLAGFVSMIPVTMIVAPRLIITSEDGLGFNEYYGVAGNTTIGKERLVKASKKLVDASGVRVNIDNAMAASPQALHTILEANQGDAFILADECADWFRSANNDSHKAGTLSYLMRAYSKAVDGDIHPGKSMSHDYQTVTNPRLSVFGTSTPSAFFGSFTAERAQAGAYNRWMFFVCSDQQAEKDYAAKTYDPPQDCIDWFKWLGEQSMITGPVEFPAHGTPAHGRYMELDREYCEEMRDKTDPLKDGLGGRLGEQAIKIAGLVALANQRREITADDLEFAFPLRRALFDRTKASASIHGNLSGGSIATMFVQRIAEKMTKKPEMNVSTIGRDINTSWNSLEPWIQQRVFDCLVGDDICTVEKNRQGGKKLVSLIYKKR